MEVGGRGWAEKRRSTGPKGGPKLHGPRPKQDTNPRHEATVKVTVTVHEAMRGERLSTVDGRRGGDAVKKKIEQKIDKKIEKIKMKK